MLTAVEASKAIATIPVTKIVAGLLCIHDGHFYNYIGGDPYRLSSYKQGNWTGSWGEGSWTDDSAPQQGGLQMDIGFQRTYGLRFYQRYGTANNWPVTDQLRAGVRAVNHLGNFESWPLTRKPCNLP
jgi:hypothetical protein